MSYIFLEKEKHESKTIQKIIIEILYLIFGEYPKVCVNLQTDVR